MVSCAVSVLSAEHAPVISFFLYLAVVLTVVSLLVGIASYIWTSVKIVRCWMYVQICATFFWTMLLFAAKIILDESGIESEFLLKNAGVGFWLGLIAAYVSLVFIMKVAEVNVGYIVLTILGVIWMFPVLWILLTALRAEQGYYVGYFFPKHLTLTNFYDLFHMTGEGADLETEAFCRLLNAVRAGEDVSAWFYEKTWQYRESITWITNTWVHPAGDGVFTAGCNTGSMVTPQYRFSRIAPDGSRTLLKDWSQEKAVQAALADGENLLVEARLLEHPEQEPAVFRYPDDYGYAEEHAERYEPLL